MLAFDLESNGLLPELNRIHCLVIIDTDTGEVARYNSEPTSDTPNVGEGIKRLQHAEAIAGHNIIGFDIPAIQKLFPWFKPSGNVVDTLVLSRLVYPDLKDRDFRSRAKGLPLPGWMIGRHMLKSWGIRLKFPKDDYSERMQAAGLDPWAAWNQEMEDYCVVDVELTCELLKRMETKLDPLGDAATLEMDVQQIIERQEQRGFRINEAKMAQLHAQLVEHKTRLERELREVFPPFYVRDATKDFVPKRDNKRMGYVKGAPLCKVKQTDFNPGSRAHIANRLMSVRGWEPEAYGKDGKPTVDDEVLQSLRWPEAKQLAEYLMVTKRLGQLYDGKGSVAKYIRNGYIHGSVNTLGTRTGRMSHSSPNVAQTPSVAKDKHGEILMGPDGEYGWEFRDLYEPRPGYTLVGCDADALELVGLAHFMARHDDGAYAETVSKGDKSNGTDPHTVNQKAVGLNTRDSAKTWFYGFIYGAGDLKLGRIILDDMTDAQRKKLGKVDEQVLRKLGKKSRRDIAKGLPALGDYTEGTKKAAKRKGHLKGLDGRKLVSPSEHSAPNTVLQSAGAVIMKRALVLADQYAQGAGFIPGDTYEWVANVHDEFQAEVVHDRAEEFGELCAQAITDAAKYYHFRCPLSGSYDIGPSWAHTH